MRDIQAVVVGAGFAGAGTGRELKRRGVDTVVLERKERVGEAWRGRYDSLRLNTIRWQSHAPGRRMPRSYGRWVRRDDIADYLESYVREEKVPVTYGVEARRVERAGGGYVIRTSKDDYSAGAVIVASGYDREPRLPEWPGAEGFEGELIHASAYRNPEPYRGKDVLVVSAGNTGSEIALELTRNGAGRVRSAMRSAPNVAPRNLLGLPGPIFGTGVELWPRVLATG